MRLGFHNVSLDTYSLASFLFALTRACLLHKLTLVIDLGKNSFALYLIHGPMIGILGERLFYLTGIKKIDLNDTQAVEKFGHLANQWHDAAWWPFPDGGLYGLEPNFLFCQVICVVVFLYSAEISTKMFDAPSVKVAKWVYTKLKGGAH